MWSTAAARKSVALKTSKLRLVRQLRRERYMTVAVSGFQVIFWSEKGARSEMACYSLVLSISAAFAGSVVGAWQAKLVQT